MRQIKETTCTSHKSPLAWSLVYTACLDKNILQGHSKYFINLEISTCDPLKHIMDYPIFIVLIYLEKSIRMKRVKYCMKQFLLLLIISIRVLINLCRLLITFADSLDKDQARLNVVPDVDLNYLFPKQFFSKKVDFEMCRGIIYISGPPFPASG